MKKGIWWLTLTRNQVLIKPVYHSPPQQDKERKCYTKHVGQDKDSEFACQLLPSFQAQLHSQLFYLLIPLGGAEKWRRMVVISSQRFVSAALFSSCSSPAPAWDASHGRQSFADFSNMGHSGGLQFLRNCYGVSPLHRVQSFRTWVLQCGLLLGSQVLSEKLLLHGLLSTVCIFPQVTSICSGTGPSTACRLSALWAASEPQL